MRILLLMSILFSNCICGSWEQVHKNVRWNIGNGASVEFWYHCWVPHGGNLLDRAINNVPEDQSSNLVCQYININGNWDLRKLQPYLSSYNIDCIRVIPPPKVSKDSDKLAWGGATNGKLSVGLDYTCD